MGARKTRARVLSATTGRIEVGRRTDLFDTYVGRGLMLPQSGPSRSRTPGYNRWISVHVQRVCPLSFTSFLDSVAMTIVEIKETERGPARKREKTTGPRRHRHRGRPSRLSFGLNGDVLISTRTRGRRSILQLTGYCQTASQKSNLVVKQPVCGRGPSKSDGSVAKVHLPRSPATLLQPSPCEE